MQEKISCMDAWRVKEQTSRNLEPIHLPCCECGHEAELAGEDGAADDAGEAARVVARRGRRGALHAQQVQARRLRRKHRPTAHRPDLKWCGR